MAEGDNALEIYENNKDANKFNLNDKSRFRLFKVDTNCKFMYVFYNNDKMMDETPFHEYGDLNKPLIPLYKFDAAGKLMRVEKWEDVKLYDSDNFNTRKEIPKQLQNVESIRTVRLDSEFNPAPLYDEAGKPVYFCDDYGNLDKDYNIFTLQRVDDNTRKPHEFLLTQPKSNSDDWK